MGLLVHPSRESDEGPSGYRYRLAFANALSFNDLKNLESTGEVGAFTAVEKESVPGPGFFDPWIRRYSRCCPSCLDTRGFWKIGWEVLFADACPTCANWLIDTCGACGISLNWYRAHIHKCDCGHFLASEASSSAPQAVVKLSRTLQNVALGLTSPDLPIFDGLRLEQCGRLIRLLGSYGSGGGSRLLQKIDRVDSLRVSWPITTMAAEILDVWPSNFYRLLDNLRRQNDHEPHGKLSKAFQGFYAALYKGFRDSQFAFLRTEFENYLSQHWTGAIGKRNRRIDESVLKTLSWIPANQAIRLLGISRRRLTDLIQEGKLRGEQRLTPANRNFIVVLRSDVEKLAATLDDGISLVDAALRLGFSRQRLLALLPIICPEAKKLGAQGCPWAIPVTWVEAWEKLIQSQVPIRQVNSETVTFDHLLRYWPWTDDQIGDLLGAVFTTEMVPIGAFKATSGIGNLVFKVERLQQWFSAKQNVPCAEVTIPELALRIGIKQEVAYSLVRSGLMPATVRKAGRRNEQRVKVTSLEQFENSYIFGRDVAKLLGRSPRAVAEFLLSDDVRPAAGPGVDHCRQLVFRRNEIEACFLRHGFEIPTLFQALKLAVQGSTT